jgi:acyl dehydratase
VTATANWSDFFASVKGAEGLSAWRSLSQLEVDLYGGLIADLDPMHNDPEWEPGIEKWGGTIVIGTHVLSMLPQFLQERGFPVKTPGVRFEVVALPRVRFTGPLRIDQRARDHMQVVDVTDDGPGAWTVRTTHTIERADMDGPFMFAELVSRFSEV